MPLKSGKATAHLTELVLVLNHKIWQHYKTKPNVAALYDALWRQADQYAVENLKDEELSYYYDVTGLIVTTG